MNAPRRFGKGAAAASIAAAATLVATGGADPDPASAWERNPDDCRWPGSNPYIEFYMITGNQAYVDATKTAAARWNNTTVPGTIGEESPYPVDEEFRVRTTNSGSSGPYAWVAGGCLPDIYWNAPLNLWYNTGQMDSFSVEEKNVTAIHEIGHVYGLDHETTATCGTTQTGLMYPDPAKKYRDCGWTTPTSDDRSGVHAIY